jgi:hypothetical protein
MTTRGDCAHYWQRTNGRTLCAYCGKQWKVLHWLTF